MNEKKVAGQIVSGTIGLVLGLAFLRAGTKTLLGATMTISEELIRKVDAKGL
ncbi:hypothetical protein PBI_COUNT_127 [Microbacterium phage Count]|nr:hypothetical protein PBI_COUNT_127 [Microbacterium phage Count]